MNLSDVKLLMIILVSLNIIIIWWECNGNLNICLIVDLTPVLRAPRF